MSPNPLETQIELIPSMPKTGISLEGQPMMASLSQKSLTNGDLGPSSRMEECLFKSTFWKNPRKSQMSIAQFGTNLLIFIFLFDSSSIVLSY